jgi:nucleoside-diphosphate-sugar epimerase
MAAPSITNLPELIDTEDALDDVLTCPRPELVEFIRTVSSPLLILGAGGKMGPTLALLAKRAAEAAEKPLDVVAVSRFADPSLRNWFSRHGVHTMSCDLLQPGALTRLPQTANLIYLIGFKFGTAESPWLTWALNTLVPAHVCERFPHARIVAFSTGNVYPLVPVTSGGAVETVPLTPLGEYPNAAVARERLFEYFSRRQKTPATILRLNYAVELRYGVLLDLAQKVLRGEPIDLTMGHLNCIWQGDANEFALRALALATSPPTVLNLTGPHILSVRDLAKRFGVLLGKPPQFTGTEADTALLSNPSRAGALFGQPPTPLEAMLRWTAHWVLRGGRTLGKPTHFEVRDGKY